MKHYFITLQLYQTKNQAHTELQQFELSYNKCLVDKTQLALVRSAIKQKLKEVNEKWTRCHNLKLSGWNHMQESIVVDGNFVLNIAPVESYRLNEAIPKG